MIGQQVKQCRIEKGVKVRALADSCGISPSYLYDIERGRTNPSLHTLRMLAQQLHIQLGDLIVYEQVTKPDEWNLLNHYRKGNWREVLAIIVDKMESTISPDDPAEEAV